MFHLSKPAVPTKGISERMADRKLYRRKGLGISTMIDSTPIDINMDMQERALEKAYFATGCFWGAERRFWSLPGVTRTAVGYMGGQKSDPTYREVCSGKTGHTEMVEVEFDPTLITYHRLLQEFWTMHDPTSLNRQGGDIGTQYRSAIYASTPDQLKQAQATRDIYNQVLTANGLDDICTEIKSSEGIHFWPAEEYHQRYLEKNPNGYDCHSTTGIAYPDQVSIR